MILTFFTSCTLSEKKSSIKKSIRINLGCEPPCLDPKKIIDSQSLYVAMMCYDGLVRLGPSQTPELSLARELTISEDKKTYTFTLKDASWSNGAPITAYDFVQSWLTILSPGYPSPFAFVFFDIEGAQNYKEGKESVESVGIKALDAKTLEIKLASANPFFLNTLCSIYFFPYPEHIEKANQLFFDKGTSPFVCSGPFKIEKWKKQDSMLLSKNLSYFDSDIVKLEELHLYFIRNQETEIAMYEKQELDWAGSPFSSLHQDAIAYLKKRNDFYSYPISGVYYYCFNTKEFPFNNKNIRKAFSLAINRKDILEHVFHTRSQVAYSMIPENFGIKAPMLLKGDTSLKALEFFIKGCDELGIDPKNFPKFSISYHSGPIVHANVAQAIKDQWKKTLGVDVNLKAVEWKIFLDVLQKKTFEIARAAIAPPSKDPKFFLNLFKEENTPLNHPRWYNNQFAFLLKKAEETSDERENLEIIQRAQELLLEEMPIAPLFFYTNSYLKKDFVEGVVLDELNRADFKWANITK